jgi:DNA mismatch endonuclease (patch repair protein)
MRAAPQCILFELVFGIKYRGRRVAGQGGKTSTLGRLRHSGEGEPMGRSRSPVTSGSALGSWASSSAVRASMRANRGRDTRPELALRRAVFALGLRYRVSRRPIPSLRRTADLVFTRQRIAVFLDGCFWHGCPKHHSVAVTNADYWSAKVQANMARDRDTDRRLAEAGWIVLRIWEHEDPGAAAQHVRETVSTTPPAAQKPSPAPSAHRVTDAARRGLASPKAVWVESADK